MNFRNTIFFFFIIILVITAVAAFDDYSEEKPKKTDKFTYIVPAFQYLQAVNFTVENEEYSRPKFPKHGVTILNVEKRSHATVLPSIMGFEVDRNRKIFFWTLSQLRYDARITQERNVIAYGQMNGTKLVKQGNILVDSVVGTYTRVFKFLHFDHIRDAIYWIVEETNKEHFKQPYSVQMCSFNGFDKKRLESPEISICDNKDLVVLYKSENTIYSSAMDAIRRKFYVSHEDHVVEISFAGKLQKQRIFNATEYKNVKVMYFDSTTFDNRLLWVSENTLYKTGVFAPRVVLKNKRLATAKSIDSYGDMLVILTEEELLTYDLPMKRVSLRGRSFRVNTKTDATGVLLHNKLVTETQGCSADVAGNHCFLEDDDKRCSDAALAAAATDLSQVPWVLGTLSVIMLFLIAAVLAGAYYGYQKHTKMVQEPNKMATEGSY